MILLADNESSDQTAQNAYADLDFCCSCMPEGKCLLGEAHIS